MMIIDYDHSPTLTEEQKLNSLKDSIQRALDSAGEGVPGPQGPRGLQGLQGPRGENGIPGEPGEDGRTPYLHIAYANSADGKIGFSTTNSEGKLYIGQYTDYELEDSADETKYKWAKIKGEQGADGFSPIVSTGESEDGSTIITITDKEGTTSTELKDGQAREDIKYISDDIKQVVGHDTYTYVLNGVKIPVSKRDDGTYYYILNDNEVDVAESDLLHDEEGELEAYPSGGIIQEINGQIDDVKDELTKVVRTDTFTEASEALLKEITDNSLIARKNARVEGNSLIITAETEEELINWLQLNYNSIEMYADKTQIIILATDSKGNGLLRLAGESMLEANESRLSTVRFRSKEGKGTLGFVTQSDGKLLLKEVF